MISIVESKLIFIMMVRQSSKYRGCQNAVFTKMIHLLTQNCCLPGDLAWLIQAEAPA